MSEYSNYRKPSLHQSPYYSSRDYFKDNLRVLRRNLLFCSGLPLTLTEEELKSQQYFGKYGSVLKVTLLKNIRQMSVYVTYGDACEASLAIIATNDLELDRYHKLASIYGTIKYCKYFLKKIECKNLPNCNYLHVYDKKNEIYVNNQLPDEVFDEHYNIALGLLREVDIPKMIKEKKLIANSDNGDKNGKVFPCPIEALKRVETEREFRKQKVEQNMEQKMAQENSSDDEEIEDMDGDDQQSANQSIQSSKSANLLIKSPRIANQSKKSPKSLNQSIKSPRSCSQKQTHQTVRSQTKQQNAINNEQFPKISTLIHSQRKQKLRQHKQSLPHSFLPSFSQQHFIPPFPQQNFLPHLPQQNQSHETLQIRLIRRMLRQPNSNLALWADSHKNMQQQVNFFHKGLDELNQLQAICDSELIRQTKEQQERLKFLIIKNIHNFPNKIYFKKDYPKIQDYKINDTSCHQAKHNKPQTQNLRQLPIPQYYHPDKRQSS